jgi:hypothetical protein
MSRHGYRGDGAFGQFMLVLPEHDAVVAIFSGNEDMQALLDHVWAHLLPAMGPAPRQAGHGDEELAARIATLSLPTARERIGGAAPEPLSATFVRAPVGPSHRSVTSLTVSGDGLVVQEGETSFAVPLSPTWTEGPTGHVAVSAARRSDGRLVVDVVFVHTPHRLELILDPATGTFTAVWPAVPLFAAGTSPRLAELRLPAAAAAGRRG